MEEEDRSHRERRRGRPRVLIDVSTFYRTPPNELLARLADGDPLSLELRCAMRRDELHYLVARRRLFQRAIARTAYAGYSYRGDPPLEPWLRQCIDLSLHELLQEDEAETRSARPIEDPSDYEVMALALGIDLEAARSLCAEFNGLPNATRGAWFAVAIGGKSVAEAAAAAGRSAAEIQNELRRALYAVALLQSKPDALVASGQPVRAWPKDW